MQPNTTKLQLAHLYFNPKTYKVKYKLISTISIIEVYLFLLKYIGRYTRSTN